MSSEDETQEEPESTPPATDEQRFENQWSVLLVVVCVAAALTLALQSRFDASQGIVTWSILLACYLALGSWSFIYLKRQGQLIQLFSFKAGDTSIGIVLGLVLVGLGITAKHALAPAGSPGSAWLHWIYLRAGDYQTNGTLILLLVLVAALEELVFRGMILERLAQRWPRFAPPLSALLYALAVTPTVFLLGDSVAGPNPLVVLAALGTGIVWAYARVIVGRLIPIILSHVVFTYFMASPLPSWLS